MVGESPTLALSGVSVVRGGRTVLHDLWLSVGAGEIVTVIGPNGAGKTSLLDAAAGALPLRTGQVLVDRQPLVRLRDMARWLFYVTGEAEPPHEVRVRTLIEDACGTEGALGALRGELLERLDLVRLLGAPAGTLSRGERRRVLLFSALVSGRRFLLLDEPTGVFDPVQLLEVVALFREHAARGHGLLLSVHQMSDAEALATRIALLHAGRILACDTLDGLRDKAGVGADAPLQSVFLALLRGGPQREASA